jgi:hypothetical protein
VLGVFVCPARRGCAAHQRAVSLMWRELTRTVSHGWSLLPEAHAELTLLCSFDEDLTADITRLTNRPRMLLTTYSPDLERAFGERVSSQASLGLLQRYPSREALIRAGTMRVAAVLSESGATEATVVALWRSHQHAYH